MPFRKWVLQGNHVRCKIKKSVKHNNYQNIPKRTCLVPLKGQGASVRVEDGLVSEREDRGRVVGLRGGPCPPGHASVHLGHSCVHHRKEHTGPMHSMGLLSPSASIEIFSHFSPPLPLRVPLWSCCQPSGHFLDSFSEAMI